MDSFFQLLRENPTIPIFLTIGLGFWAGKFSWKGISLGSVTSVLLIGVLIGQINIPIGPPLKDTFFLLFLFAIGYRCGPQFAGAMKGSGPRQVLFALVINLLCFGAAAICAKIMHYNAGIAAGLYAGSSTISPVIGVAADAINNLPVPGPTKRAWIALIPVCYAVTYLYGTIGAIWILGTLGPRMLGGLEKVRKQTKELEDQLSHSTLSKDPAYICGANPISFRAHQVNSEHFSAPRTVREIEEHFAGQGKRIFVERVRTGDERIHEACPDMLVSKDDAIVISGRHEFIIQDESWIGPELHDPDLLNFSVQKTKVMITKKAAGLSLDELRLKPYMYGVIIESITSEDGIPLPVLARTTLNAGDMVTIQGLPREVELAAREMGVEERPTNQTDMVFLFVALAIGAFIGALSIRIGGIPVGLSTSGGALISGIFFGWLRTMRPSAGIIPEAALWLLNNLGLNLFIAVIGIQAGPSFISGIREVGFMLFVMGFFATTVPLVLAIWIGDKIFKFHPAINLGCCAGGRKTTPGIGAVTSALGSSVPALGYTITYAVSNTISIFLGVVMVLLFM
ncbi:MAG: aspartate-alanine antiporter [Desulfovibrio sp.]|nr:aspartate-alanine antiporter [Desulfovibrio sp.]